MRPSATGTEEEAQPQQTSSERPSRPGSESKQPSLNEQPAADELSRLSDALTRQVNEHLAKLRGGKKQ